MEAKKKQIKYRTLQYTCLGGEFVSAFAPFIIMGAVNADKWFKSEGGWKIGLGGALALALMGLAVFLVTQKKEKESKVTNGWITLIVGWFAVAFVFVLLANIMDQIATIMLFGGIGLCGAFGLDLASKSFQAKADLYKETRAEVQKDALKEEIKEEQVKIKVKVTK